MPRDLAGNLVLLIDNLLMAGLFFFPAGVTWAVHRRGWPVGLLMVLALAGVLILRFDYATGSSLAFAFGGVGLVLWHYGKRPIRLETFFAGAVAVFLLGGAGLQLAFAARAGLSPIDVAQELLNQISLTFDVVLKQMTQQGGVEQFGELKTLQTNKWYWVWLVFHLSPSLLVVMASLLVMVNLLLVRNLLPATVGLEFNRWRAPDIAIWAVVVPGLGLTPYFILEMTGGDPRQLQQLYYFSLNVLIIGLLPFLGQGLAVMSYFFKKWRLPRLLRALTYFMTLTQFLITAMVAVLGLAEFWTDLRGRSMAPKEDPGE